MSDDEKKPLGPPRAPDRDDDLHWIFCEAAAALGVRSTFGAVVNYATIGIRVADGGSGDGHVTDRHVVNVTRYRRLLALLDALPDGYRSVLELAYGEPPRKTELQVRDKLRRFFALVPQTKAALEAYAKAHGKHDSCAIWLVQHASPKLRDKAIAEAEDAVAIAFAAFAEARGDRKRRPRQRWSSNPPPPVEDAFAEAAAERKRA